MNPEVSHIQKIEVTVNGDSMSFDAPLSIAALLKQMALENARVAVEVNMDIVTRSLHEQHLIQDGDIVEVVQAIGGG
ncbi:thiamine biosynthesis protein ThiS [Oleiphilus messinensis]|uniref:Thiamine biosynthesis protein ThiS n=1 Tax=Oleiphilus messinensis TaxID=141451 RepID=A0A1Y0IG71_9GAMM|nr:sulfur carrier protein ThiS [Oleiphilus messinensis]ARU58515.1 thiamine biosynthesis protein ThiS [Oleiphilus messinensis]